MKALEAFPNVVKDAFFSFLSPVAVSESDDVIPLPSRDEEISLHRSAVSTNIRFAQFSR